MINFFWMKKLTWKMFIIYEKVLKIFIVYIVFILLRIEKTEYWALFMKAKPKILLENEINLLLALFYFFLRSFLISSIQRQKVFSRKDIWTLKGMGALKWDLKFNFFLECVHFPWRIWRWGQILHIGRSKDSESFD